MIRAHSPYNPADRIPRSRAAPAPVRIPGSGAAPRSVRAPGITVIPAPAIDTTAIEDPYGIYQRIADAGPITAGELTGLINVHPGYVQPWLDWQSNLGYLHRDEQGRYAPYCAWPRLGY